MSKIICEICGTAYPDTEPQCPICGWTQDGIDLGVDMSDLDFTTEEAPAPQSQATRKNREIFDYDAVNAKAGKSSKTVQTEPAGEPEEEEEERGSNPFLVVLLTILIVALLAATGYVLIKYFLPSRGQDAPQTSAPTVTTAPTETTELRIPCTGLSLVSGITELNAQGQNWLLHVVVTPEDTTDILTYESMDESVATVNEEGRVTAVAEGQTTVVITCGAERLECPVTVNYQEATEVPTEAPTEAATTATVPEETTGGGTQAGSPDNGTSSGGNSGVELKLKKTDITFGRGGVYTTLELDCDLNPEDITWSTRNSNVATVKNGVVTAVGPGLTVITAKYGDQTVECIVRCNF